MAADKKFANDAVAEYSALKSQAESIISDAKAAALSALEKKVQEIEKKYALDVAAIDKDISRKLADEDEKMSRLRISLHKDAAAVSLTLRKSIEEKFGIYNHD